MGCDGVRLASIGLAGLMMYLVDSPHPALGRGESDGQMTRSSSFGSAISEPQGGQAAAPHHALMDSGNPRCSSLSSSLSHSTVRPSR